MYIFDSSIKVFYRDVDQMGVVYYTRYFEYFEQARTELFNSIGLNWSGIEKDGYYLPVVSAFCKYKRGAEFEDKLLIKTKLMDKPGARVKFDYEIIRETDELVLAAGYTKHGFTDHNGKPVRPPRYFQNAFKKYF